MDVAIDQGVVAASSRVQQTLKAVGGEVPVYPAIEALVLLQ